jgi:AcrR family transcriptional regulator
VVRPRFVKLPAEQQQVILGAALEEFAAHGFHDASLNRVIKAAGSSKGSMYYYFDGKEDLYAYVVRTALERMLARCGPFPVPSAEDVDAFWSTLAGHYLRLMSALSADLQLAALVRGWVAVPGNAALQQAQLELGRAVLPWVEQATAAGRRIGAVRTDVPSGLLVAVVLGMGQAMDTWLLTEQPEADDLPRMVEALVAMIRGAVQPPAPR